MASSWIQQLRPFEGHASARAAGEPPVAQWSEDVRMMRHVMRVVDAPPEWAQQPSQQPWAARTTTSKATQDISPCSLQLEPRTSTERGARGDSEELLLQQGGDRRMKTLEDLLGRPLMVSPFPLVSAGSAEAEDDLRTERRRRIQQDLFSGEPSSEDDDVGERNDIAGGRDDSEGAAFLSQGRFQQWASVALRTVVDANAAAEALAASLGGDRPGASGEGSADGLLGTHAPRPNHHATPRQRKDVAFDRPLFSRPLDLPADLTDDDEQVTRPPTTTARSQDGRHGPPSPSGAGSMPRWVRQRTLPFVSEDGYWQYRRAVASAGASATDADRRRLSVMHAALVARLTGADADGTRRRSYVDPLFKGTNAGSAAASTAPSGGGFRLLPNAPTVDPLPEPPVLSVHQNCLVTAAPVPHHAKQRAFTSSYFHRTDNVLHAMESEDARVDRGALRCWVQELPAHPWTGSCAVDLVTPPRDRSAVAPTFDAAAEAGGGAFKPSSGRLVPGRRQPHAVVCASKAAAAQVQWPALR